MELQGLGKTEVYLQLIRRTLEKNKSAIMLVPEISLTPQMVDRFSSRFGDCICVLHSKLSVGERNDQWKNIQAGKCKIVIGARSAIFAPIDNLGIIIIDEEHDSSYKSEMTPKYEAKEVARFMCKEANVPLLLGSATPDIDTYYRAKKEEIMLLKLKTRANKAKLPEIEVIDLREELAKQNKSMISTKLYEEIEKNLKDEWTIDRVSKTNLSILKLATFEIIYSKLPYKVVINEAIELAKRYGDDNSYFFVNGILANIVKELKLED